jgi:hypothetical protein
MKVNQTLVACVMVCARLFVAAVAVVLIALPSPADGQPVYFEDDFDGTALKPHWIQPPPEHWEYDVSGGMLNVTKLKYPSTPHTGFNIAELWAPLGIPATGDFLAEVVIGFDPATLSKDSDRVFSFFLSDQAPNVPPTSTIGISYQDTGFTDVVLLMGSGGQSIPSPVFSNPGLVAFQIARMGNTVNFSMNGDLLATLPATPNITMQSLGVWYIAQWPDAQFEPIHIDRITIVPSPGVGLAVLLSLPLVACRTRR